MLHKVSLFTCPECSFEKVRLVRKKRCSLNFQCKNCKHVCNVLECQKYLFVRT